MASDDDLLARLNALKPSTIDLERTQATPRVANSNDGEDIARRFLGLRKVSDPQRSSDPIAASDTSLTNPDEVESIDDMYKEFRSRGKTSLAEGDNKRVEILLAQAQAALEDVEDSDPESAENQSRRPDASAQKEHDLVPKDTENSDDDQSSGNEDAEADALLAQILDEVHFGDPEDLEEPPQGEAAPDHSPPASPSESTHGQTFDEQVFPATPSKEPEPLPAPESDALELPSAPTNAPQKPKPKTVSRKYADEEIDTWCEICQADAEVRCLGCDGDLFCMRCWKEGHTGPDVGYEERMHRCVQYNKPGRPEAAAA